MKNIVLVAFLLLFLTGCATYEGAQGGYYGGNACRALMADPWAVGNVPPTCYGVDRTWR